MARNLISLTLWALAAANALCEPHVHGSDSLDPTCGVVFAGTSARLLTESFFSRGDVGTIWDPTPIEISQLEEVLGRELGSRLSDAGLGDADRPLVRDYFRQYAGIHLKGRRLIFVNGFHRSHVKNTANWLAQPLPESQLTAFPVGARSKDFWRIVPVHVNDGGNLYFEAFYDPQRKRILGFQFNGIG
jgi:hypothetical protein